MTTIFSENFDTGTLGSLNVESGTPTVVSDIFHSNPYSMRVHDETAYAAKAVSDTSTERTETYYVMVNRFPDGSSEFYLSVCAGGGQSIAIVLVGGIGVPTQDSMALYSVGYFEVKWYNARNDFLPNIWHKIQVFTREGVKDVGGGGEVKVTVDDVERIDATNVTVPHLTSYGYGLINPYVETGGDIDFHFDDIDLNKAGGAGGNGDGGGTGGGDDGSGGIPTSSSLFECRLREQTVSDEVFDGQTGYKHSHFDSNANGTLVFPVMFVVRVHAITIQAQGTVIVNLTDGNGGASLTEWSLQAREGVVYSFAPYPACWVQTSFATALYVTLSAAVQVTINVIYSDTS